MSETETAQAEPVSPNAATISSESSNLAPEEITQLTDNIVGALKTVYDPEIPVDIYELGLIYKVDLDDNRNITIDMTDSTGLPGGGGNADLG